MIRPTSGDEADGHLYPWHITCSCGVHVAAIVMTGLRGTLVLQDGHEDMPKAHLTHRWRSHRAMPCPGCPSSREARL